MSGFFKKLLGGKSVKDTAMGAAKAIGLDPDIILRKIFAKFAGGEGKGMDLSALMGMVSKLGIGDKNVSDGFMKDVFDKKKDKDSGEIDYDKFKDGLTDIAEKKYEKEGIKGDKARSKLEQQIVDDCDLSDWGIDPEDCKKK